MYIKIYSFILCLSAFSLLEGVNQTVTFDLTKLPNNVATATLASETDSAVTLNISNPSDWGGNTNAINVDSNGLMVTDTASSSFDFTINSKGYEYFIAGYTIIDASPITAEMNVLRFQDVLNVRGGHFEFLYEGYNDEAGYYETELGRRRYDQTMLIRLSSFQNDGNVQLRFGRLDVTLMNVPEPATYALLLGGLVLSVSLVRRVRL